MSLRKGPVLVLAVLVGAGILVGVGSLEDEVGLFSVVEVWGDVLRDADHFGLRLTRVSPEEEMDLGTKLATAVTNLPRASNEDQAYVTAVGRALTGGVRRQAIGYEFHVVQSNEINAFALPGGQVFVYTGMLGFIETEAELAAVLGHEISHVDLRHCIERYQYELAAGKLGVAEAGQLLEIARRLVTVGYNKYQEAEADALAIRLSEQAGYDPSAAVELFTRMHDHKGKGESSVRADGPVEEAARAVGGALSGYLRSHPYTDRRVRRLSALLREHERRLASERFYRGRRNFELREPRSERELPGEWTTGLATARADDSDPS